MIKKFFLLTVALALFSAPSFAMDKAAHVGDCSSCHTLSVSEASALMKPIGGSVKSVKQSPVQGLFELLMEKDGKQGIIYLDYAKKHLMQGMAVDIATLQPVSAHIQEEAPTKKSTKFIDTKDIPVDGAIILGNPKSAKKLYVFTDPECPYCRSFHAEMKKLLKIMPDLAVHIMLYPLSMHPAAYERSRSVLEAGTIEMLDKAFEEKELPKASKASSKARIDANIKFANQNGISGTPTLVMPDGRLELGGRDAATLKKMLSEE